MALHANEITGDLLDRRGSGCLLLPPSCRHSVCIPASFGERDRWCFAHREGSRKSRAAAGPVKAKSLAYAF